MVVESAVGWVIKTFCTDEQFIESVTVAAHVPAGRLVAVLVVCEGIVFQMMVNAPVPPLALMVAIPLLYPLQVMFVCETRFTVGPFILLTGTLRVAIQPLASVAVAIYNPTLRFVAIVPL